MTDQELIDYYVNLLIMQYITKVRARGTVSAFVRQAISDQIIQDVNDGFDLETAVGAQLTAMGTYRGAPRDVVGFDFSRNYFAMPGYDDDPSPYKGFALYGDTPTWYFLQYEDANASVYTLSDDELRQLIQLFAQIDSSTMGLGEVDLILYSFFSNNVTLIDNADMTIEYEGQLTDPDNLFRIVKEMKALPSPAGVEVTYTEV